MSIRNHDQSGSLNAAAAARPKVQYSKACAEFKPQKWRQNVCSECFFYKEHHTRSVLEEALGMDSMNHQDPTEVFELIDIIGAGAYGSVFLGRAIGSDHIYAIKFMEIGKDEDKHAEIMAIVNEVNIMKESTNCPFVVEYHGCYMKDEVIMMVMEHCSCSVEDILSFCPEVQFSETQIAAVCAAIVKGLAFLHAYGITHRDIKSGNVLLKESGEVKLADFGVSRKLTEERDKMKTLAGSPYWCAPELIAADSYNNKVDIWACGIVALEMAESRPPHWDLQPLEVILHIPKAQAPRPKDPSKWSPDFLDFLDKCLQKDPANRACAKDLLYHPFILSGSSSQILVPLIQKSLPLLLPRKKQELREEADDTADDYRGTMVSVDTRTYTADVVQQSDPVVEKALTARMQRLSVVPPSPTHSDPSSPRKLEITPQLPPAQSNRNSTTVAPGTAPNISSPPSKTNTSRAAPISLGGSKSGNGESTRSGTITLRTSNSSNGSNNNTTSTTTGSNTSSGSNTPEKRDRARTEPPALANNPSTSGNSTDNSKSPSSNANTTTTTTTNTPPQKSTFGSLRRLAGGEKPALFGLFGNNNNNNSNTMGGNNAHHANSNTTTSPQNRNVHAQTINVPNRGANLSFGLFKNPFNSFRASATQAPPRFFGVPLEESVALCKEENTMHVTDIIFNYLVANGLETEGLFRISGDQLKIAEAKRKYKEGAEVDLSQYNIHVVAGLLKLYFRELPECLLTVDMYDKFLSAIQIPTERVRLEAIRANIAVLPPANKEMLQKLIIFLATAASRAEESKMTAANLARCIAPNLLFRRDETMEALLVDSPILNGLVETLIEKYQTIFK